eukprot:TRINITY_DN1749_c0_g4_i1.p2 TRINITY_DN1749_c0_g4~~TRINITY_DN1749_c0_g4_i1.p2  ORF type:complete len:125 (-),score=7.10 TRINITY_DN1749_c0_g4_i1:289-663(-)
MNTGDTPGCRGAEKILCFGMALISREVEPSHPLTVVLRNAKSSAVTYAELVLGISMALVGTLAVQDHCLGWVFRNTCSIHEATAEKVLRICIPLLGRSAKPLHRFHGFNRIASDGLSGLLQIFQ